MYLMFLNTAVATVGITINQEIYVTGIQMTASTGSIFISAWAVVDIGISNSWTVVNTSTTNTWAVVDIAA